MRASSLWRCGAVSVLLTSTACSQAGDGPTTTSSGTDTSSSGAVLTGSSGEPPTGSTGEPPTSTTGAADTSTGEPPDSSTGAIDSDPGDTSGGSVCRPGAVEACYDGPVDTLDVGACHAGTRACLPDGGGFGPCMDQVVPVDEQCDLPGDEDCDGASDEPDAGCGLCEPGTSEACYDGPPEALGVGPCAAGTRTCMGDGRSFGPCVGAVVPVPEACSTYLDDDCDGAVNEPDAGCVCPPLSLQGCYTGPSGTDGVGTCKAGTQVCEPSGLAYGPCMDQGLPTAESCANGEDEDCDDQVDEGCAPVTWMTDVRPIFQGKCAPCHTVDGAGGANFASTHADTQKPSYYCPGETKGLCTLIRVKDGSMPQGKGCTGDPALDAGKPACLTAQELGLLQAWIEGGQQP